MATISKKLASLINDQINAELYSAYLYQDIADYYHGEKLIGFAKWFDKQAEEELEHAKKFIDYLRDNGEKVVLKDITAPKNKFKGLRDGLALQLTHEEAVTAMIYRLMDQAVEEKDYRAQSFLKWFVDEQTEEEAHSHELLEKFDLYGSDLSVLYRLDSELGGRK